MKRITLRLPDDLHEQLVKEAGKYNRSLNAQIVTYLEARLSNWEEQLLNNPRFQEQIEQSRQSMREGMGITLEELRRRQKEVEDPNWKSPTLTHDQLVEQILSDPGVRAEYDKLGPEFEELRDKLRKRAEELSQLANLPEDQIDTSDIPEQLDWSDAKRGLFHREAEAKRLERIRSTDEDFARMLAGWYVPPGNEEQTTHD